ncbi:MAG: helix-turn-helix domain-containing protein, partial [Anaerolineae bacterium]
MAGLGQFLREARERKGSSWQEIEAATGLWPEYVQALERDDYSHFASEGHLRSALRLYARYLGLDMRSVLALLEQPARREESGRREIRSDSPGTWFKALMVALAAMLMVGVCAVTTYYGYDLLRSRGSDDGASGPVSSRGTVSAPSPTPIPSPTPYQPISSTSLPRYVITA